MTRALGLLLAALAVALVGCGEDGESGAPVAPDPPSLTEKITTGEEGTESPYATTETGAGGGEEDEENPGDAEAGAEVYASSGCGGCHTLDAAGSSGNVGPDLDDTDPTYEEAVAQVTKGGDGMPAFADQLSEQQIRDVAAYVAEAAGGS